MNNENSLYLFISHLKNRQFIQIYSPANNILRRNVCGLRYVSVWFRIVTSHSEQNFEQQVKLVVAIYGATTPRADIRSKPAWADIARIQVRYSELEHKKLKLISAVRI